MKTLILSCLLSLALLVPCRALDPNTTNAHALMVRLANALAIDISSIGTEPNFTNGFRILEALALAAEAGEIGGGVLAGDVDVAAQATGGDGSSGTPWTGWDTAITWTANIQYRFRSGYYSYANSPNFALDGIRLVGSAGTVFVHTGTGVAFNMDAGGSAQVSSIDTNADTITVASTFVGLAESAPVSFGTESGGTLIGGVTDGAIYYVKVGTLTGTTFQIATTPTGTAINLTGSVANCVCSSSNWISNSILVDGIRIKGGATTTDGFFIRGIRNSLFRNLSVIGCTEAAFRSQACVTNVLQNFNCTHWQGPGNSFAQTPKNGIIFEERGSSNHGTTTWTVLNSVIEGVSEEGIWLKAGSNNRVGTYGNTFINGTTEEGIGATQAGVRVKGRFNVFLNYDSEANTSNLDFLIEGDSNTFEGCTSSQLFKITGNHNMLGRGQLANVTLTTADGGYMNFLNRTNIGGTLTEGGSSTIYLPTGSSDFRSRLGVILPMPNLSADGPTISPDCALYDCYKGYISADTTINNPTNATQQQKIDFSFYGAGVHTLTWGGDFDSAGTYGLVPPSATQNTKFIFVRFVWNTTVGKWVCVDSVGSRQTAITAPSGGAVQDAEARTAIGSILTALQNARILQ